MHLASVILLLTLTSPAWAIDPFELQCSKAFDNLAESRAGMSWEGANKARFCRCISKPFAVSADLLADYNLGRLRSDRLAKAEWDCYERSDLTTKRRR